MIHLQTLDEARCKNSCFVLLRFFSRKKKKLPTAIKTKHTVSMLSGTKPSLNKSTDTDDI